MEEQEKMLDKRLSQINAVLDAMVEITKGHGLKAEKYEQLSFLLIELLKVLIGLNNRENGENHAKA